ncbi:TPA: hypothetical protein DD449_02505 [Candidatus Berkelbacteria bacterium]|nr:hypothetical protein [Candidatus Berkelbacteria bacterium]
MLTSKIPNTQLLIAEIKKETLILEQEQIVLKCKVKLGKTILKLNMLSVTTPLSTELKNELQVGIGFLNNFLKKI